MILNTGARTDTVQYYSEWLLNRFAEGYVLSRNPLFPEKVTRYELTPEAIDLVMFCSKNYEPILPRLHEITDRFNTYFHYTITAYGRDIEPGVPSVDDSIRTLLKLERQVGRQRIVWRYDPVLLLGPYTVERHLQTFEHLCSHLAGHIDRCVFSFVGMYKKLQRNMPELKPVSAGDKLLLAEQMGLIAHKHGVVLQTCGQADDYTRFGIGPSACTRLDIMGPANNVEFRNLKHKGMRAGCGCFESRDIGAYNTCPNGCRYCYANYDHAQAARNYQNHNPASPLLIGNLSDQDEIVPGSQKSLLKKEFRPTAHEPGTPVQESLF
ncbi:Domain of uncharacterised function (DUF1848) [Slackia heliotrinireducens]|uniref:DNA repair photolyase n=1 Tax=Slackia heliotrinireducens (strain ATCC 29202 / DSM 20476 / NCTC 11029 / RHS 1) TaxID=471855 RepID=C7N121_SLAHD|nr:DUF1848 domain-containing protein [Slackia heliotrinireducens]ACV23243.1 protein of unknown function (DUF1848) [Slackia heliotrinireducens DSM 20476]VEH02379.1 Domain of uncharacterised function (DUF1848) [Slackia heliotrinireducens]